MNLQEAKEECQRWFDYHQHREDQAKALQKLAADRRTGKCNAADGERRRMEIQGNGVTVYDGSNLADAVRVLLKHLSPRPNK